MPTIARYVFVYGTLRRGEKNDITRMQPAPGFVGLAHVPGVLYHLGRYPGLVLGGPGRVLGEVYAITAVLERQLDQIEDVWPQASGEYAKREILVQLPDVSGASGASPARLLCLVYEIHPSRTLGKPVIASGDWVQRRRNTG